MMRIAVTGATGFIGQQLCPYLEEHLRAELIRINRIATETSPGLSATDDQLIARLHKVDCLIHLAARAHNPHSSSSDYERDNQQLCARIVKVAVAAGVGRIIYLSSIKVNGESTSGRAAFNADETPAPQDAYGYSKLASETILKKATQNTTTQLVIIRPPLVYGRKNKGNLHVLTKLIRKGIPLPFAGLHNKRDLVSTENLCSLIALSCSHSLAAGQTFLVSDGTSRTTGDIVQLVAESENLHARLFTVPHWIFSFASLFKPGAIARLTGDLQVDITKTVKLLGWSPRP